MFDTVVGTSWRETGMAGKVINLRRARKRKERDMTERRASENRAKFGRSKSEKERDRKSGDAAVRHLDDHRIEGPEDN